MPSVVAYADVKALQFKNRGSVKTPFLKSSAATPTLPVAQLSQGEPGRIVTTHFHWTDEFQVITEGLGTLGRHPVRAYCVHFARAGTAYGPLAGDSTVGMSYFTLFSRFDPGPQYSAQAMAQLKQMPGRQPWQLSRHVSFPDPEAHAGLLELPGLKDERGLYAGCVALAPGERIIAPAPSSGDGQFILIMQGSMRYDHFEHEAIVVVFVPPSEPAFELRAGRLGLAGIILNLPRVAPLESR